ncbi:putative toxin-antitoxin system toxin component, PIN family [Limihaloglobus sulfuriphilus]|uniref:Putative toxin-antitoxin system toxin component, PIN family n=1 Tax=Limihaloglobus sulfuriphilus TaxID=1851148 RepID=A0A1Q2MH65_9BACT|nr:putative toxin-antitoxin system toxin component, PIN family [Limihaloglobus sulfuriphilus]AQQ71602.1 putative toxin-antitoxin system toxin component, PIN family [Limihaloglobus sulfuriphilus]
MKTPIVVVDTNVFVSGIFFSGPPYSILKAWQDDRLHIAVTKEIIEEYRRVIETLSEKFESTDIDYFWELLLIEAELVPSYSFNEVICEDPDDDKFLACAIAAKSKYIISGDKHLLKIGQFLNTKIVTPRYFLDNML